MNAQLYFSHVSHKHTQRYHDTTIQFIEIINSKLIKPAPEQCHFPLTVGSVWNKSLSPVLYCLCCFVLFMEIYEYVLLWYDQFLWISDIFFLVKWITSQILFHMMHVVNGHLVHWHRNCGLDSLWTILSRSGGERKRERERKWRKLVIRAKKCNFPGLWEDATESISRMKKKTLKMSDIEKKYSNDCQMKIYEQFLIISTLPKTIVSKT